MWPLLALSAAALLRGRESPYSAGAEEPWHETFDVEPDEAAQAFAESLCGTNELESSTGCERYAHMLHNCYPVCGDYLAAYDKAEWERCVIDCTMEGLTCPEMCAGGTPTCAQECYQNHLPTVKHLEKLWIRYHHRGVHPGEPGAPAYESPPADLREGPQDFGTPEYSNYTQSLGADAEAAEEAPPAEGSPSPDA